MFGPRLWDDAPANNEGNVLPILNSTWIVDSGSTFDIVPSHMMTRARKGE